MKTLKSIKWLIVAALMLAMGCEANTVLSYKNQPLVIKRIRDCGIYKANEPPMGRYEYFIANDVYFFSDSIYQIGDTLKITK